MLLTHLPALNAPSTHIVLASGSPRRKDILHTLGFTRVVVRTSAFEEDLDKSAYADADAYARATALGKARDVYASHYARGRRDEGEADVIIGADTVVESRDGRVLEKPSDAREAKDMLRALSNGSSKVHTGVAIILPNVPSGSGVFEHVFSETTLVEFGALTEDEIDAYIATGEPFDKAGGYGIQGQAGAFIKGIVGDYYNVMGFPMHAFSRELAALVPMFVK
jgi:septum formation protein